jgi:metallo-beta-lactamase family protein
MSSKITFLGATGTVTGSKYLLEFNKKKYLIDCGLFQGFKQLRLRNWAPFLVHPSEIEAVILTHAHIDHTGYLPLLVKNGFQGKIFCSEATKELCALLLPDSGYLQEEEARYANQKGFSKHKPALPLYTRADAEKSLRNFQTIPFHKSFELEKNLSVYLQHSGHILGSAFLTFDVGGKKIVFSGDIGRLNDPIMNPPETLTEADYLICESTYGDRLHEAVDPKQLLGEIINKTAARGGKIIIPSFAVGRAQSVLYLLHQLKLEKAIPNIPVYLNSPMAVSASKLFCKYHREHRLSESEAQATCDMAIFVNSTEESKNLNFQTGSMIIIAASGMATGGRVIHHLKAFAPDPKNTILFVGYQAGGTRGEALISGAEQIKIHGEYTQVNAEVKSLPNLSAHADYAEIITWLKNFKRPPQKTFLVHGEPSAADAMRKHIEEELGWESVVPDFKEEFLIKS